jgi:hypothetical protein
VPEDGERAPVAVQLLDQLGAEDADAGDPLLVAQVAPLREDGVGLHADDRQLAGADALGEARRQGVELGPVVPRRVGRGSPRRQQQG